MIKSHRKKLDFELKLKKNSDFNILGNLNEIKKKNVFFRTLSAFTSHLHFIK